MSIALFQKNKVITESAYGNRFLFQGREYDYDTALYYFRNRWYEPETGRWLSPDPIGISGGLNLYTFCGNDPVNFVDPDGLWTLSVQFGFGLAFKLSIGCNAGHYEVGYGVGIGIGKVITVDRTDDESKGDDAGRIAVNVSAGGGLGLISFGFESNPFYANFGQYDDDICYGADMSLSGGGGIKGVSIDKGISYDFKTGMFVQKTTASYSRKYGVNAFVGVTGEYRF